MWKIVLWGFFGCNLSLAIEPRAISLKKCRDIGWGFFPKIDCPVCLACEVLSTVLIKLRH